MIDFKTRSVRKGSGAVLIDGIKGYILEEGMKLITMDFWAGNDHELSN